MSHVSVRAAGRRSMSGARLHPTRQSSVSPSVGYRVSLAQSVASRVVPVIMSGPLMVSDVCAIVMAASFVLFLKPSLPAEMGATTVALLFLVAAGAVIGLVSGKAYGIGIGPVREFLRVSRAMRAVFLVAAAAAWLQAGLLAAIGVLLMIPLGIGMVTGLRSLARQLMSRLPWWGIPVVIVQSDATASIEKHLRKNPKWGFKPVVAVEGLGDLDGLDWGVAQSSGWFGKARRNAARLIVDESAEGSDLSQFCEVFHVAGIDLPSLRSSSAEFGRDVCIAVRSSELTNPANVVVKRCFDVMASATLLVLGSPILATLALLVRLGSSGDILFGQQRVGRCGRSFMAWKFRTMVPNAEAVLASHLESNPALKSEWEDGHKLRNDPRITSIGHFLRKTSLDELPQLWNVLVGEMSLVGPRPIVDDAQYDRAYIEDFPDVFESYQQVRPGITGLWQVSGRNLTSYEDRVEFDRFYLANWSLSFDVYILLRTLKTVLLREGAF